MIGNDIFRFVHRVSDLKIDKNLINIMLIFQATKKILILIRPKKVNIVQVKKYWP